MKKTRKDPKLSMQVTTIRVLDIKLVEPIPGAAKTIIRTGQCESLACYKIII